MSDPIPKKSIDLYATSTIAMSILSLLAVRRCALPAGALYIEIKPHHPGLERYLVDRALKRLLERRLIVKSGIGYRCTRSDQPVIVARDRSDFTTNHETGEQEGGWNGWVSPSRKAPVFSIQPILAGGAQ